jgi:hypothetical protein
LMTEGEGRHIFDIYHGDSYHIISYHIYIYGYGSIPIDTFLVG